MKYFTAVQIHDVCLLTRNPIRRLDVTAVAYEKMCITMSARQTEHPVATAD